MLASRHVSNTPAFGQFQPDVGIDVIAQGGTILVFGGGRVLAAGG